MNELVLFIKEFVGKYPEHRIEVMELYQLCKDEIEQGGSPENEIYLCEESIKQLLEDE